MFMYGSGFPKAQSLDSLLEKKYGKQTTKYCLRCLQEANLSKTVSVEKANRKTLQSGLSKQGIQSNGEKRAESETPDGEQSCMERRGNLLQEEGQLSKHQICQSPKVGDSNGEERRLHNDSSFNNGKTLKSPIGEKGGNSSSRPQSKQQRNIESDAICIKCGTQIIRGLKVGGIKPAYEPIVWAVKPPEGSYVDNVLKWGVGAVNVDECRVGHNGRRSPCGADGRVHRTTGNVYGEHKESEDFNLTKGRFPANVILDEEAGRMLDEQSGMTSVTGNRKNKNRVHQIPINTPFTRGQLSPEYSDSGGASRFFYCAKASRGERNAGLDGMEEKMVARRATHGGTSNIPSKGMERFGTISQNNHPTVKPIKLFEYLIKLVTRKGQAVLDPFMGSGTTSIAAHNVDRKCIGIEKEDEYLTIAKRRIDHWKNQPKQMEMRDCGRKPS